jgi:hypothetical protein
MREFPSPICPSYSFRHCDFQTGFRGSRARRLQKLGSRLYTRNLTDDPARLVRRNWY